MKDQDESKLIPYELVYASMVVATMLGNYVHGMFGPSIGPELSFQVVLICTCLVFFAGALMFSPVLAFLVAVLIQFGVGGYWPSIGALRGRYIVPEQRSTCVNMARVLTMLISSTVLRYVHDSAVLMMSVCALLCCTAAYVQHEMVTTHTLEGEDFDDFEKDAD